MIDSISDGVNKATAQVIASEVYTEILNQWMTAQGTIDVELPTGTRKLSFVRLQKWISS